mmetsp:Transcript_15781/g.29772  ORF Transcript_15781/g.29772 Transcript_15781/m.29772 type:complete len:478 (+) Transcript_15781:89-1522(+)|eukprot:CAMPEP_0176492868 /NCGR_PEP_ID=MMETSP0200_2-20121128/9247_1 /TAXON_ID=947934 /ORGANISM="Chaetoceros sp., Strain GSL56" /LENGTH=477 /DNA_ID=CAMNT_0017890497 /DNA_START=48 /DNA_END=1481 /DNA_ORIENTATION=-
MNAIGKDLSVSQIDEHDNSLFPSMTAVVVQDQEKGHYTSQPPVTDGSSSNDNDFLVSEHEDNDGMGPRRVVDFDKDESRRISTDSGAQIIGDDDEEEHEKNLKFETKSSGSRPTEIPPENDVIVKASGSDNILDDTDHQDDDSDYSYDYEDDEDGHYSGFIISSDPNINTINTIRAQGSSSIMTREDLDFTNNHNIVVDDDQQPQADVSDISQFASLECSGNSATSSKKSTWKEPTQEAISMSLRVESEKSGGRRRLASDLYKVMMTDTKEAGFQVEQKDDECMDKWTVKLFNFDVDSDLYKDMIVLGLDHIELEMSFPEQYPFEPPFVRVVRPRFERQTGFVMNGALCMELLTNEGWNPINDIESVIVSIRSLLVVGDGRLEAAVIMPEKKRDALLAAAAIAADESQNKRGSDADFDDEPCSKRKRSLEDSDVLAVKEKSTIDVGSYSTSEAKSAYSHLTDYHKKKGWSGWWAKKG